MNFFNLTERKVLLFTDFLTINLSTFLLFYIEFKSGLFTSFNQHYYGELVTILPVIYLFWFMVFLTRDMYKSFYFRSLVEISIRIFVASVIGVLLIYFFTISSFDDVIPQKKVILKQILYFIVFVTTVGSGRIIFKLVQNYLIRKKIGLRKAIIIGYNKTGKKIVRESNKGRLFGIDIVGFVDNDVENIPYQEIPIVSDEKGLSNFIKENNIREVLIATEATNYEHINDIILKAKDNQVNFKIIPSLNNIISGHVRTSEIFGYPLIELFPELLTPIQGILKRLIDVFVSLIILLITIPIMIISAIIIKFETPGEIIYKQKRVGKDFKEFTVYKFRSMGKDAEAKTGAVWASQNDPRITKFGGFMRKTRIDELPQLLNVLLGNMSFVGPRPERKVFVDQFVKEIPFYYKRFHVKPGLTGWAQVKHKYDESFDDVKEKLRFDLFYIENMSIQLDLVIIMNTISVVLMRKGQ